MTQPTQVNPPVFPPRGFKTGAMAAGIKPSGSPDLAAILSDRPATTVGVLTRNRFCGAPVMVNRLRLTEQPISRGILVNSGVANVCTGDAGLEDAWEMTRLAARAAGVGEKDFLVASTGIIGRRLPMDKIGAAIPNLLDSLKSDGWDEFSRGIMTTDTVPKAASRQFTVGDRTINIVGVAKGSGMIEPDMATMLAFVATDYAIGPEPARAMVKRVADRSFNRVTVDGDTSTSDMFLLFANGAAIENAETTEDSDAEFEQMLTEIAVDLARMIARDGEGATRLVTIDLEGAPDDDAAHRAAKTIANSPLVKTAIFGNDPNWGRIAAAVGRAGVAFDPGNVQIDLQEYSLMRDGQPQPIDEKALSEALKRDEVLIHVNLGNGPGSTRVWTCDLTYDYVRINAEYTT